MASEILWTSADGRQYTAMDQFDDRHLVNIIRLQKRRILSLVLQGESAMCYLQEGTAKDPATSDIDWKISLLEESLDTFVDEAERRGLKYADA